MTAFTKEQLIARARENLRDLRRVAIAMTGHDAVVVAMQIQVEEIAIAALTAEPLTNGERAELQEYRKAAKEAVTLPNGWQLVPIEPTEDMVIEGFESEPDPFFGTRSDWDAYRAMSGCQQAAHRARLCWAAMLKATPKVGGS